MLPRLKLGLHVYDIFMFDFYNVKSCVLCGSQVFIYAMALVTSTIPTF